MNAPDNQDAWLAIRRLYSSLTFFQGAMGLLFAGYLMLPGVFDTLSLVTAMVYGVGGGAIIGLCSLLFTHLFIGPLRAAANQLQGGRILDSKLAVSASRRARLVSPWAAVVTFLGWITASGLMVRTALLTPEQPRQVVVASLLPGLCIALIGALFQKNLVSGILFPLRLLLPGQSEVRKAPLATRLAITGTSLTLACMACLGGGAYLFHRWALEKSAVASCDRAIKALVGLEISTASMVEAAAKTCGGSAAIGLNGQEIASIGERGLLNFPVGRGSGGVLLRLPLRSGATLYVLVSPKDWQKNADGLAMVMMVVAALMAVVICLFALVFSRTISVPLSVLARGMKGVAAGDITYTLPPAAEGEIGSLYALFAAMVASLRRRLTDTDQAARDFASQVQMVREANGCARRMTQTRRERIVGLTSEMTQIGQAVDSANREVTVLLSRLPSTSVAAAQLVNLLRPLGQQQSELETLLGNSRRELQGLVQSAEVARAYIANIAIAVRASQTTVGESGRTLQSLDEATRESVRGTQRLLEEIGIGERVVKESVQGVEAICGVVAEAKARVKVLDKRSSDIAAVVDFIGDVAGRTNLLSLNASIIAAQAGEQGKPFAVVADNIQELATQIGNSTKRISDIVAGVRLEIEATRLLIQQSDELAAAGVERARESGSALQRIAGQANRVQEISSQILPLVAASSESTQYIEQFAARGAQMTNALGIVEQLARHGKSLETLMQSSAALVNKVSRGLESQIAAGQDQTGNLDEISSAAGRVQRATQQYVQAATSVSKNLGQLLALTGEDSQSMDQLTNSIEALAKQAQMLNSELKRFLI